jgi:oligopeptidase B
MNWIKINCISFLVITLANSCNNDDIMSKENNAPPVAERINHLHKIHNDIRVDEYYWLNDRENPEVIDYLERENDYFNKMTKNNENLNKTLFEEMKSRIKENDSSVPYFYNEYWYITRFEKGKQYPIYTRRKETLDSDEEILFNCNDMANGHDYFSLVGISISPDNSKAIYAVDTNSRRKYTIHVKDLNSGDNLDTYIEDTNGGSVWSSDSNYFFYMKKNSKTLRSETIYRHSILQKQKEDFMVYHEKDSTFSVYVQSSKSRELIFISSHSTLTSEYQFINSSNPLEDFKVIQPRISGLEYTVSHFKDHFYIVTNINNSFNYKIAKTAVNNSELKNWKTIIDHREDVLIEDIEIFQNFWAISERHNGLNRILIKSWNKEYKDYYIPVDGETYSLYSGYNPSFETDKIRYVYNSLTQPNSTFEFDMTSMTKRLLKKTEVLDKNFDSNNYIEKRIWATSRDGTKIPISLVHHKNLILDGTNPTLQYAYGSYGATIDPGFSSNILSLLNRGFIYAISHVRGSEYLGRKWYESGKLFYKKNTFNDFIDCSKYLIEMKFTNSNNLHAYGGSAGGLLMGVVVNEAPDLYKSIIAAVPFVDVVTTMLDDQIPLTTSEYDEWGNPNLKNYYDYMKSYSPYDNIKSQNYPNIYITAGLHDSQVQYWEPAKWVARLRHKKTDNNVILLETNMESGHSGASGRFNSLKETAKKYSFLLSMEEGK